VDLRAGKKKFGMEDHEDFQMMLTCTEDEDLGELHFVFLMI